MSTKAPKVVRFIISTPLPSKERTLVTVLRATLAALASRNSQEIDNGWKMQNVDALEVLQDRVLGRLSTADQW